MEKQGKTFSSIKVNQLNLQDQQLAYENHIFYFKIENAEPYTFKEFLNQDVANGFFFGNAKEGSKYWITTLNKIVEKQNNKRLYNIDLKLLKSKQIVLYIIAFICFIFFVSFFIFIVYLLFQLFNL
jgi:hypothetical protein